MARHRTLKLSALGVLLIWPLLSCHGLDLDWREDEQHNNLMQPPEEVMNSIGIREGMVIGEIGARYGRFTIPLAQRVGPSGTVYANDIDESSLSFLRRRCDEAGLENVETILGSPDDPLFPKGSLDMAISSLVYHELEEPVAFLRNVIPALKPDAPIVIVDYDPTINRERSNTGRDWLLEFENADLHVVRFDRVRQRDMLFVLMPDSRQEGARHRIGGGFRVP